MTPQEAYLKGLTDAENIVIEKLQAYLSDTPTSPFNNPALENVRQQLLAIDKNSENVKLPIPNIVDEVDLKLISKLESSIKYPPDRRNWSNTEFGDERLNNLFKAWINIVDYHWNVSKQKHAAGKVAKRILSESKEMLNDYVDIEVTDDKSLYHARKIHRNY